MGASTMARSRTVPRPAYQPSPRGRSAVTRTRKSPPVMTVSPARRSSLGARDRGGEGGAGRPHSGLGAAAAPAGGTVKVATPEKAGRASPGADAPTRHS